MPDKTAVCSRCKERPRIAGQYYCRECKRKYEMERYAAREPEKRRERRRRFEELEAWCRAENIRELVAGAGRKTCSNAK